jgi:Fe-S cluster assembly protein SufB
MKYPAVHLLGENARGEVYSLAVAKGKQHQDTGAKMVHCAPNTRSTIISKSISKDGGQTSYRGLVKINKGAKNSISKVSCDALILDKDSRSDTYPTNVINESDSSLSHEATVSKIGEEQLFYMMSRGLSEEEANSMIVNGFADPIIKKLPLEYALELNRLLEVEMTGSVG